jgi:hypothetical protein
MPFETPPPLQAVAEREQTTVVITTDHCLGAACPTTKPAEGSLQTRPHATPGRHSQGEGDGHRGGPHKDAAPPASCHLPEVELTNTRFSERSSDQPGIETANLYAFHKKADNIFNPVRPPGLAEVLPGQASHSYDYNSKLDERNSQASIQPDGSMIFRYDGKLSHWGWRPDQWNASSTLDTRFTAQETVDKDNQLVSSNVKYLTPTTIDFVGQAGSARTINNVTMVDMKRQCDGSFVSRVQTADGGTVTYRVNDRGQVIEEKPEGRL